MLLAAMINYGNIAIGGMIGVGLWILSLSNEKATNVAFKLRLFTVGTLTLFFTSDRRWKKQPDSDLIEDAKDVETKKFIFIRHGESEWNEVFNRGFGPSFPVRLIKAMFREMYYLVTRDSIFVDTPLCHTGLNQASSLYKFLKKDFKPEEGDHPDQILLQTSSANENSVVCCSNLRRAISTALITLQDRLQTTGEKVYMLSSLQEISRNIDANAIAPKHEIPDLHGIEKSLKWPNFDVEKVFETSEQYGQKPLFSSGMTRIWKFNEWAFNRKEGTVIVGGGHSLWFREYFKTFMPKSSTFKGKKLKVDNCAACSFTVTRAKRNGKYLYRINEDSFGFIYGSFKQKESKK
jgi:bisphosphoglycerate-dependent phosphoglycerate mutase